LSEEGKGRHSSASLRHAFSQGQKKKAKPWLDDLKWIQKCKFPPPIEVTQRKKTRNLSEEIKLLLLYFPKTSEGESQGGRTVGARGTSKGTLKTRTKMKASATCISHSRGREGK